MKEISFSPLLHAWHKDRDYFCQGDGEFKWNEKRQTPRKSERLIKNVCWPVLTDASVLQLKMNVNHFYSWNDYIIAAPTDEAATVDSVLREILRQKNKIKPIYQVEYQISMWYMNK